MFRPRLATTYTSSLLRVFERHFSDHGDANPTSRPLFFRKVLSGNFRIDTRSNAEDFLSAVRAQRENAIGVVEELLASKQGLNRLHDAFNIDIAPEYVDKTIQPVLSWLQDPALQSAGNGLLLRRTLSALVNPPGSRFWSEYYSNVKYETVNQQSTQCFAWLLLQLLTHANKVRPLDLMIARDSLLRNVLAESPCGNTRLLGQRIQRVCDLHEASKSREERAIFRPRHENDFQDFKNISIVPIAAEVSSNIVPRLWRASEVHGEMNLARRRYMYMANLFRVYRQDWVEEIKEKIQALTLATHKVKVTGTSCNDDSKKKHGQHPWALKLKTLQDLPELKNLRPQHRQTFIKENTEFIPDRSLAQITADGKLIAFVKLLRDEAQLAASTLCIRFPDHKFTQQALHSILSATELEITLLNTAGYAHEPVLRRLQEMTEVPLEEEIVFWDARGKVRSTEILSSDGINELVRLLETDPEVDLKDIMGLEHSVVLDASQVKCLVACLDLKQRVILVQGPPGTGEKSFTGALAAKALFDSTNEKILVVCQTNQALDQFVQDMIKIGINASEIVRLGGQERTDPVNHHLLLSALQSSSPRYRDRDTRAFVKDMRRQALDEAERLEHLYLSLTSLQKVLNHLDAKALRGDGMYSLAFETSLESNGTSRFTDDLEIPGRYYLLQRWIDGDDPGVFPEKKKYTDVWDVPLSRRKELLAGWKSEVIRENLPMLMESAERHDELLSQARDANGQLNEDMVRSKRIIACTTTGAAKYAQVQSEAPGIIIVEEAGQVLESHIITALNPHAKKLILIGDHKQLRPFANYKLSVEQGDGYDLNRSMFERLVLKGYPHHTLAQQHRMRPEISDLVRQLTYPDLIDAPKTLDRPNLRGFSDNVIFVNHEHAEDQVSEDADAVNIGTSKRNTFEAEMAFRTVKYLLQQNYEASSIVVLTPYLGQLEKLQEVFGDEFETVMGEFDSMNLAKGGSVADKSTIEEQPESDSVDSATTPGVTISTTASEMSAVLPGITTPDTCTPANESKPTKSVPTTSATPETETERTPRPRVQISTIDNYQGQESDIVVASLTRSNPEGDIGFLCSPERVNVLLSRARNALIILGNTSTFKTAAAAAAATANDGKAFWSQLINLLEAGNHMYNGVPVKCETHPDNTALLRTPEEFGVKCAEGGCMEMCGVVLKCGVHVCGSTCHHLGDHSGLLCRAVVEEVCNRGLHMQAFECCERINVISKACEECQAQDEAEARRKREIEEQR